MIDYIEIGKKFKELGINNFQAWDAVIPLDKVFGLDEKKHNGGTKPYGVSQFYLDGNGTFIEYYTGNIFNETKVCSRYHFSERKGERLLTESEENGVNEYCMKLINDRKAEIEKAQRWLGHLDEFAEKCLAFAKEFINERSNKYYVELMVGNSHADKRVAPALVIRYKDGSQRGYVKLLQNQYGDIKIDACCMCHSTSKIEDLGDMEAVREAIGHACYFVMY